MAPLHTASSDGSLTEASLRQYLANTPIDSVDEATSLTALAAACRKGHLDVVRILLNNAPQPANPNAVSSRGRTPLHFATTTCPPKNRAAIVRLLLKFRADVNSSDDELNTPLMNAISEVQDKEVVRELVEAGAVRTMRNANDETAETLAEAVPGMKDALQGRSALRLTLLAVIQSIVSVVMFIIAYVNSGKLSNGVKNIARSLYGISGEMPSGEIQASVMCLSV